MRVVERLLRGVLVAYPPQTSARFGDEIVETALARIRRAHATRGLVSAARLVVKEAAGILASGMIRRREVAKAFRTSKRRIQRTSESGASPMDLLLHDVRIAARSFLRQPGFTLGAVLALALGIGAAVAIFSVFNAVLLRPLPFHEPSRLVSIWEKNPERGWHQAQVAAANYLDWRESTESFTDMAAYNDWFDEIVLLHDGEPRVVLANEVTGNFFDVLGVSPLAGRVFDDAHTWAGVEPAVVLSYGFWSRQFGGDRSVVGDTIELDGAPHRVLGVMPRGFAYPFRDTELWIPVAWDPEFRAQTRFRRAHGMRVVGRLEEGVSLEQAESELAAIAARLERDYPETNQQMGNGVTPLREWIVGDTDRPLQILMASVGFVLLVACANVSNMLLARTSSRQDELRVRSALGGARYRLVLQGLIESLLLAGLGGSLGLLLGVWAIRPLLLLSPEGLPRLQEISVDMTVVIFAFGITLVAGLALGSLPAWRGARLGLTSGPRGSTSSRKSRRTTGILVAAEVALTLPLIVGAGLMVRTLDRLSHVQPGFVADDVVVAKLMAPSNRYESDEAIVAFYRETLEQFRGIPGVEAVSMSSRLPFGNQRWSSDFTVEGWPAERFGMGVRHDEIAPGLFRTMGVPLLRGRDFEPRDGVDSAPVIIINEALATTYFPGEDPIGKRVTFSRIPDESSTWRTIVGVVANVRREALSIEEEPSFYAPVFQDTVRQLHVLMRSERDPASLVATAQERLHSIDPRLPLFDVTTLESELAASLSQERYLVVLLTIAALVALTLASLGIFAVVSYATARRVREIGIRMALGARASSVMALVVRSGLRPVIVGAVLGLVTSALLARAMSGFLFEVEPLDPVTFVLVLALVIVAAIIACTIPARRATRIDASSALRTE